MKLTEVLKKITLRKSYSPNDMFFTQKNRLNSYFTWNGVQIIGYCFSHPTYWFENVSVIDSGIHHFDHYEILADNWIIITEKDIENMKRKWKAYLKKK